MNMDITNAAIRKFPETNLTDLYWVWFSERHLSIFFSVEGKLAIYNGLDHKWQEISLEEYSCDTDGIEALTTTDNDLIFAGFAGDFEVYALSPLEYLKTIDIENSGYGAAAFKNNIFINSHEPFGIKMIEIPSGKIIREFPVQNILSEDFLLNSISCNDTFLTAFFETTSFRESVEEKNSNYYISWNFHTGSLISKIPSEMEGYEDPILINENRLVVDNKIYDLTTSKILVALNLPKYEYIITAINHYIFTVNDSYNQESKMKRLQIYKKNELFKELEFKADDFYTFKNSGNHILILKDNYYYLISLESLINSLL